MAISTDPEELARRLRDAGLRVTGPRLSVLSFLASTGRHPNAEEVQAAVNAQGPVLARASVYNVLRSLGGRGLVREVVGADASVRFDANVDRHHHFVCRICGGVEDVPWEAVRVVTRRERLEGRQVEGISVTLEGACGACTSGESTDKEGDGG